MSLFLGPIHHWMFEKITFQNDLIQELVRNDSDQKLVDDASEPVERGNLEDLIDTDQIHGWLQERVQRVEKKLAAIAKAYEADDALDELLEKVRDFGRKEDFDGKASEAYDILNRRFLEGMPCDRIYDMKAQGDDEMAWEISRDIHREHWTDDQKYIYPEIKKAWLEGLLAASSLNYSEEEGLHVIK